MSVAAEKDTAMSVVNMAKDIKKVHPEDVVMYKVGNFVQSFGKDAYILSYVFDYKLRSTNDNISTCGYPKNAIQKVIAKLEQRKLNYIVIDTRNNYGVDEKSDNGNLNKYEETLVKAKKYIKIKNRLKRIENFIFQDADKENVMEKIRKMEEIAYENRKV